VVVGYALGNKSDSTEDIRVLGERDPDVLTYSRRLTVVVSRMCRNDCPYCQFHRADRLSVPYSTIKLCHTARQHGAREVLYLAGERADKFPDIRSVLDLWGFDSFLDYLYTVTELGFLEGLIPIIEVGLLFPAELKRMSEICSQVKIMLDSIDAENFQTLYPKSPGKRLDIRLRSLHWAGKINFPTVTGIMVGIGESRSHRQELIQEIANVHKEYGTIQEVHIQNFVPQPGTPYGDKKPPKKETMLQTVEMALEMLPKDISVTVPIELNPDFDDFIKAGIRDLGYITEGAAPMFSAFPAMTEAQLYELAERNGFRLQQRFPLRFEAIKNGKYSNKLGQVFDAYRYKIKKEEQERLKAQR